MPLTERLPALAYSGFRGYLLGAFVSNTGGAIQYTAVATNAYLLTEQSLYVGMIGLVTVVPLLLFSLFGGVIADQHDRRKVMLLTQSAMALVSLGLMFFSMSGIQAIGPLYLLIACNATARAFDGPSRQSLVANLVPPEALPNALSLSGISWRLSEVIGPIVMGSLIVVGKASGFNGLTVCYALNFVSFGAMLIGIWRLPPYPPEGAGEKVRNFKQVLSFIKDGMVFVRKTKVLRSAMLIDFWATFFSAADALLPAFALDILDLNEQALGVMMAAAAVGAFAAAAAMAWIPTIHQQGRWIIGMIAVYGLATVLFGLSVNLWMAVVFLAITGAADMVSTILRQTIRQLATPDNMRGRMTATGMIFQISGPRLGDFESGLLAKFTGERLSVVIGGAACCFISAYWMKDPALRDYEHASATKLEE